MQPFQTVPWDQYLENWKVTNPELRNPGQGYTVPSHALPPGLAFSPLTGELTGKPRTPGTYTFYVHTTNNLKLAYQEHEANVMRLWRQWIRCYRENALFEMHRRFAEIRREFNH